MKIADGEFSMGSTGFYPDEAPVTKAQFRECVEVTGYVSVAERPLDPGDDPGADPADLVPGALVFTGTPGPVDHCGPGSDGGPGRPGARWCEPAGCAAMGAGVVDQFGPARWQDRAGSNRQGTRPDDSCSNTENGQQA